MIKKIASNITDFIISILDIDDGTRDIYQYGIELMVSSFFNILFVMLCALLFKDRGAGLIYLSVFIFLRLFCGGYHSSTYFRCNVTMIVAFTLTYSIYWALCYWDISLYLFESLSLVNFIPIILYAPVSNEHKPLTENKRKKCRLISIILIFLFTLCAFILFSFKVKYGLLIVVTLSAVSVMIIIEIFLQRRGYHNS